MMSAQRSRRHYGQLVPIPAELSRVMHQALPDGSLAGVGSAYVGTHSVLITIIAAITAILLAAMVLMLPRQGLRESQRHPEEEDKSSSI